VTTLVEKKRLMLIEAGKHVLSNGDLSEQDKECIENNITRISTRKLEIDGGLKIDGIGRDSAIELLAKLGMFLNKKEARGEAS